MTLGEWLDSRAPGVPPRLMARIRDALGSDVALDASRAPEACIEAAARVVAALLGADQTGRGSALSLLAADALVTLAFEAGADDPVQLAPRANAAMQRLAASA